MWFAPLLPIVFGLSYFIRVDGRPAFAASGLIFSALMNVVLDYLFIVKWGWGIGGAALATGGSQIFGLALLMTHFTRKDRHLQLTAKFGSWREIWDTCYNGSSEFINEISGGVMIFMFNWVIITHIGAKGIAAFSIVSYTLLLGLMAAYGFSDPMAPLVSANFAADRQLRGIKFLGITQLTVLGTGMTVFIILALFPGELAKIFLPHDLEVAEFTEKFIRIFKYTFLFNGANIALATFFTGLNHAFKSVIVAAMRGFILPVLFLLSLPPLINETGIFITMPLTELLTFALAFGMFIMMRETKSIRLRIISGYLTVNNLLIRRANTLVDSD